MIIQRSFISEPSGEFSQTITEPVLPIGGHSVVYFADIRSLGPNAAVIVRNDGSGVLTLWYDPSRTELPEVPATVLYGGRGGNVEIHAGKFVILRDVLHGPAARYTGGPLTIIAGTISYTVALPHDEHEPQRVWPAGVLS